MKLSGDLDWEGMDVCLLMGNMGIVPWPTRFSLSSYFNPPPTPSQTTLHVAPTIPFDPSLAMATMAKQWNPPQGTHGVDVGPALQVALDAMDRDINPTYPPTEYYAFRCKC